MVLLSTAVMRTLRESERARERERERERERVRVECRTRQMDLATILTHLGFLTSSILWSVPSILLSSSSKALVSQV